MYPMNSISAVIISRALLPTLISALIFFYYDLPIELFAASPSFPDKEITDNPRDWIDLETRNSTRDADLSTDILAVDYYSNGKILNATLWLGAPFKEERNDSKVNYGMYIDADFDDSTGFMGVDYKVELQWNNQTKNWSRIIESWPPIGKTRVLENISNYTGIYKEREYYVLLNVDWKTCYYQKNTKFCSMLKQKEKTHLEQI